MTAASAVRLVVAVIAGGAFLAWLLVWFRCVQPDRSHATVPGLWALHVLIFVTATQFHLLPAADLNLWSNAVRIHGLIASLVLAADYLLAECNDA